MIYLKFPAVDHIECRYNSEFTNLVRNNMFRCFIIITLYYTFKLHFIIYHLYFQLSENFIISELALKCACIRWRLNDDEWQKIWNFGSICVPKRNCLPFHIQYKEIDLKYYSISFFDTYNYDNNKAYLHALLL